MRSTRWERAILDGAPFPLVDGAGLARGQWRGAGAGGGPIIRSSWFGLFVVALLMLGVLALLRVRFAVRFWRNIYLVGVALVIMRLLQLAWIAFS